MKVSENVKKRIMTLWVMVIMLALVNVSNVRAEDTNLAEVENVANIGNQFEIVVEIENQKEEQKEDTPISEAVHLAYQEIIAQAISEAIEKVDNTITETTTPEVSEKIIIEAINEVKEKIDIETVEAEELNIVNEVTNSEAEVQIADKANGVTNSEVEVQIADKAKEVTNSEQKVEAMNVISNSIENERTKYERNWQDLNNVNIAIDLYRSISNGYQVKVKNSKIVKTVGNIEEKNVTKTQQALIILPDKLVTSFVENDWKIYVTEEDMNQVYFQGKYQRVLGMTSFRDKWIKIGNFEDEINMSVFHEFGHYLDYINKFPSKSEEFRQIYIEEVGTFIKNSPNPGAVANEKEFFAETFHYMLENQSICTPKAMQYVSSQLNTFLN